MRFRKPLIIAVFLIVLVFSGSAWWNNSWNERKIVEVSENSGRSLSNYHVNFTINTESLVDQGELQADCSDIRFVDSDDSTEIDYWIENGCNTPDTEIWFEMPSLASGGTDDVYLYYDNPSASSASSLSGTVPDPIDSNGYTHEQFIGMKWQGGNVDCTSDANFDPYTARPSAYSDLGSSNWDSGSFWDAFDTGSSGVNGDYSNYQVDFDTVWGSDVSGGEAYMGAYIWSPDSRTVDFSVGSDDTRKVWVNGDLEHQDCEDQGLTVDESTFSASLDKGRNLVLMMVNEDSGGWGGQWRISSGSSNLQYTVRRADPAPAVKVGAPDAFNPLPEDNSQNQSLSVDLSVNVTDPENENMNVTFKARDECPSNWTRIEGVCYNESVSTKTWTSSQDYCSSIGGHLVTVNDEEENEALNSEFGPDFWIGYNDRASEGNFEWANESSTYNNWSSNEPNDSGGEDCTEIYPGGGWNDYQCDSSSENTAMCEKIPEEYEIAKKSGIASQSRPEATFSNLETNKTYYWSVEVTDGFATTLSDTWSFSTVPSSLCDFRGPKNECVVETEKNISGKEFSKQEIFETTEEATLNSVSGSKITIFNRSILSGSINGQINITAEEIVIKPYTKIEPEGRVILNEK